MNNKRICIILFLIGCVLSLSAHATHLSMRERLVVLRNIGLSHPEYLDVKRNKLISNKYSELFSQFQNNLSVNELNSEEVKYLYMASSWVSFFLPSKGHIKDMELDISELERRGKVPKQYYIDLYERYVKARMFLRASELSKSHPALGVKHLPVIKNMVMNNKNRSVYVLSDDKKILTRVPLMPKRYRIFVVIDPLCHFAVNSFSSIINDPVLGDIFKNLAVWIVPPEPRLNFDIIQRWNNGHPHAQMVLAHHATEWPVFNSWETPTFYFFKNSKLVAEVIGWPKKGRRNELIDAAIEAGIIHGAKHNLKGGAAGN